MELLKRYVAAASMGVVALVCMLVGLLGVTVLRPPTQQVSSADATTDLIMTRGNVLSIVKDDVTVTATSKAGAPVTLSIGTTQDVKGWIGDAAYTEVIGVESDRTKLKAEEHDAVTSAHKPTPAPQSGAQSGVQSSAQPLDAPTASDLVTQLASSDMWFKQASGEGTVSLDLENVPAGRSALAASAAGAGDLTLTLTWNVEQTNTLAIISFLAACVFALITLALFLTRWQLLRLRKIRAARIEERRKADSLETSSIDSAAVAQRVAAASDAGSERSDKQDRDPDAHDASEKDAHNNVDHTSDVQVDEGNNTHDTKSDEDAPSDNAAQVEEGANDDTHSESATDTNGADEYVPDPLIDTFERRGRHGLDNGPFDEDPPERATTDTGVIDLSGIRGGRTLPSRRALREARNNGEEVVVVDGQEFDTGLIPVTRPRDSERDESSTPAAATNDSHSGGWTSIMSSWLKDHQDSDK